MLRNISPFWRVAPVLIFAHALQTTWFPGALVSETRPDLPFLVALAAALLGGFEVGSVAGIGAGLLSGLAASWHVGSFLVARALPPALLGNLAGRFSVNHPFAPPLCAFCATVMTDLLFMLMSPADFSVKYWTHHAIATGITHALLIWPVFWIVARVVKPPQRSLFAE